MIRRLARWVRGRARCVTGTHHTRPYFPSTCRYCGLWLGFGPDPRKGRR